MARNSGVNCGNAAVSSGDRNVFDDATCAPTGEDLDDSDRFDDVADLLEADPTNGDPDSYDLSSGHPAIDRVSGKGCGDPAVDQTGCPVRSTVTATAPRTATPERSRRLRARTPASTPSQGPSTTRRPADPLPGACVHDPDR